jgi:hypothetical protein
VSYYRSIVAFSLYSAKPAFESLLVAFDSVSLLVLSARLVSIPMLAEIAVAALETKIDDALKATVTVSAVANKIVVLFMVFPL